MVIWCIALSSTGVAQEIQVSDPRLEIRDNRIHITYDILKSTSLDRFMVDLSVTDAKGNAIKAVALSGDIGDMVPGGDNRHIVWDLEADQIKMNASIFVKLHVKVIPPPEPVPVSPGGGEAVADQSQSYSRTGIILQSVAFPGLGLSRLSGNPHWIRGVLAYTCVAGSVAMNRMAISTYDGISDLVDYDDRSELYQKSVNQDNASEILAYVAIGIWVTDLVWTVIGTSNMGKGFSILSTYDPLLSAPLIGLTYKF